MKKHNLIPLIVFAITVPVLTGCDQKVKYSNFLDIFENAGNVEQNNFHYIDKDGEYQWGYDIDSFFMNEIKKLPATKRFTSINESEQQRFVYDVVHYRGAKYTKTMLMSHSYMTFYANGSIIVNDYGEGVLDSYNYFSISQEEMTAFYQVVEDRFEYAREVKIEDMKITREEKGVYQLLNSLKQKENIPASVDSVEFKDTNQTLLETLENTEFTYLESYEGYLSPYDLPFVYNTSSADNYEDNPWFFGLSRDCKTAYVMNYISMDRVGRNGLFYYNTYSLSREAGNAIMSEARRIAGIRN